MTSRLFTLTNCIFSNPPPNTRYTTVLKSFLAISRADLTHEGLYNELGNLEEYKNLDTVQILRSLGLGLRNPHQEHYAGGIRESRHESGHRLLRRCKQHTIV